MKRTSIIIGLLSSALALSACSSHKAPSEGDAAKQTPAQTSGTTGHPASALTPTPEQQKAAQQLLNQTGQTPAATPSGLPLPGTVPGTAPSILDPEALNPTPSDSLPVNLRGIRPPVPPEEAASRSDSAAPAPNAVELRGLRSPSMPKTLPMDITGKQNTGDAQ